MMGYKKYVTVIMDGSNDYVNKEIRGVIDMVSRRRIGNSRIRKFDRKHPTMKKIVRKMKPNQYSLVKTIIEGRYPGLCTFNARV